jgi:hypothetical protein
VKRYEFTHKAKQWDLYKQFHANSGPFTEFENGSLIVHSEPNPDRRRMYDRYGIQLVTTSDKECPQLYSHPDAETPLKKAWITQGGQQMLAIDHTNKHVVRLREGWRNAHNMMHLPANIATFARAYWAKPEEKPLPLNHITVSIPDKVIKNSLSKKLEDVTAVITAMYRMQTDAQKRFYYQSEPMQALHAWDHMTVEEIVTDLTSNENAAGRIMHNIATHGFTYPRAEQRCDYLFIK